MKKPLNYRLQMYRALVERCVQIVGFGVFFAVLPFFALHSGFLHLSLQLQNL